MHPPPPPAPPICCHYCQSLSNTHISASSQGSPSNSEGCTPSPQEAWPLQLRKTTYTPVREMSGDQIEGSQPDTTGFLTDQDPNDAFPPNQTLKAHSLSIWFWSPLLQAASGTEQGRSWVLMCKKLQQSKIIYSSVQLLSRANKSCMSRADSNFLI